MNQLKFVYNIQFLDSYSHPIHTCLSMIASNGLWCQSFDVRIVDLYTAIEENESFVEILLFLTYF